jgi:hypothetical protein
VFKPRKGLSVSFINYVLFGRDDVQSDQALMVDVQNRMSLPENELA